ncbi:MAG: hypothetical protein EU548_04205 [Promethearchaeota archaeon]|nr:MAG: hypothetical protein EU548_04205 [Candidatus Lokiarchaeota archaeon]
MKLDYALRYLDHLHQNRRDKRYEKAYRYFYDLFKDLESVDDKFTISFMYETGAGILADGGLYCKFSKYGIEGFQLTFNPSRRCELHKAIQTMLFWANFDPKVMAIVQEGGFERIRTAKPILFGYARGKLYSPSYIGSSSQSKTYRGNSYWQGETKKALFEAIMREFNGDPLAPNNNGIFKRSDHVSHEVFTDMPTNILQAQYNYEKFQDLVAKIANDNFGIRPDRARQIWLFGGFSDTS